jgi:hypothetical protein
MHNWSTFGARTSHGQIRIHKRPGFPPYSILCVPFQHLPPYSILYASPPGPHLNGILSRDFQMGIPKIPKLRLSQIWGFIIFYEKLRLRWGLIQSCNSRWKLFNDMSHVTCTQGNQVNFRHLVVESQTTNLTPVLSFGHNLCFRSLNGSCEPILDINISIAFQWYKEFFNTIGFDPYISPLKIQK